MSENKSNYSMDNNNTLNLNDKEFEVLFDDIKIEDKDAENLIEYETTSLGVCGEVLERDDKYDRKNRIESKNRRIRQNNPRSNQEREAKNIVKTIFKGTKSLKDNDIKEILKKNGLEAKMCLLPFIRSYLSDDGKLAK